MKSRSRARGKVPKSCLRWAGWVQLDGLHTAAAAAYCCTLCLVLYAHAVRKAYVALFGGGATERTTTMHTTRTHTTKTKRLTHRATSSYYDRVLHRKKKMHARQLLQVRMLLKTNVCGLPLLVEARYMARTSYMCVLVVHTIVPQFSVSFY